MMHRLTTTAALALALAVPADAGVATPPPPPAAATDSSRTTAFVGLNWVFGAGSQTVEGILGVAHGKVSNNDVSGAKAALHFRLNDGVGLRKFKLTGLFGDPDVQGEVGGGFNFETGSPIGVIGANGDHFAVGADISFDGLLEGYVGVHSIGDFVE